MSVINIKLSGSIFDGRAPAATKDLTQGLVETIATTGVKVVQAETGVFKHPTGYYRSQIAVRGRTPNSATVDDGGVIYGPWLEGVGSRNAKTRFKGYKLWLKATSKLKVEAVSIAKAAVSQLIGRIN
jgi:hypothetical protein